MASEEIETDADAHVTAPIEVGRLTIRSHASVVAAAHDPETFSSAVSRHLHVPNGLDGAEHAEARRLLDPFFAAAEIDALEPELVRIADALVALLVRRDEPFDAVADLGARFAVRAQSAWLGWSPAVEDQLLSWVADNRAASRSRDPVRAGEVARRFDAIIGAMLDERTDRAIDDVTSRLMALRREDGRPLTDPEIVSVLRNWTGGDLSSLALCAGVVVHWLAHRPEQQRVLAGESDAGFDAAIDEILRADDPFVSNRRIAVRDTVVDVAAVSAGDVVLLDWRAANRDPQVFGDPDAFEPARNAPYNLVYGTGPHVCPGRPLATRELRVLVRSVLGAGELVPAGEAVREQHPVAGFRTVPVRLAASRSSSAPQP
ncbi:cytochrome P450 [Microbacterium immunditiarum]|uniref:Cytochrome P450 n=1 Tax=Microbacterium immunditiarum TaxID=337480 RepID=A0A7Y9KJ13_9MICO|nr:cytochrome P450 [Microbacterium immunditiarum]NYE19330.1 cytochrome P450 [Microbacterium immunditiarum]